MRKRCLFCAELLKTNRRTICMEEGCHHDTSFHSYGESGCAIPKCLCKQHLTVTGPNTGFTGEKRTVLSGYGMHDNGYFCSIKHAYYWALKELEKRDANTNNSIGTERNHKTVSGTGYNSRDTELGRMPVHARQRS